MNPLENEEPVALSNGSLLSLVRKKREHRSGIPSIYLITPILCRKLSGGCACWRSAKFVSFSCCP